MYLYIIVQQALSPLDACFNIMTQRNTLGT